MRVILKAPKVLPMPGASVKKNSCFVPSLMVENQDSNNACSWNQMHYGVLKAPLCYILTQICRGRTCLFKNTKPNATEILHLTAFGHRLLIQPKNNWKLQIPDLEWTSSDQIAVVSIPTPPLQADTICSTWKNVELFIWLNRRWGVEKRLVK